MNKNFTFFIILLICGLFTSCSVIYEKTDDQYKDLEECTLNKENASEFSCMDKSYTILEERIGKKGLGEPVAYIGKLIAVGENGEFLMRKM